ncbi:hypothetical protein PINS_up024327 [Pythium insidiosum]|nr:hypothetical protein PINS_up024327 [Pythium insidiosum]
MRRVRRADGEERRPQHFHYFKTGQPPDIPHDPNFHLMADNASIVAAMVGVLGISATA